MNKLSLILFLYVCNNAIAQQIVTKTQNIFGCIVKIKSAYSGKIIQVGYGSKDNNGEMYTYDDGDDIHFKWQVIDAGKGYVKFKNSNSNKYLVVYGGGSTAGDPIVQYDDVGQQDILWKINWIDETTFYLANKNSGKCVAIEGGSKGDAKIIQWDNNGQGDIKWQMSLVGNCDYGKVNTRFTTAEVFEAINPTKITYNESLAASVTDNFFKTNIISGKISIQKYIGGKSLSAVINMPPNLEALYQKKCSEAAVKNAELIREKPELANINCPACTILNAPMQRCVVVALDFDGDGSPYGQDCDDNNNRIYPGAKEIGGNEIDEDCNPATFGNRDNDGDGFYDAKDCNTTVSGAKICGTDCDDNNAAIIPGAVVYVSDKEYYICNVTGIQRVPNGQKCVRQPNGLALIYPDGASIVPDKLFKKNNSVKKIIWLPGSGFIDAAELLVKREANRVIQKIGP
jgi:hypothetical protein